MCDRRQYPVSGVSCDILLFLATKTVQSSPPEEIKAHVLKFLQLLLDLVPRGHKERYIDVQPRGIKAAGSIRQNFTTNKDYVTSTAS